ncbi:MAG: hypothetical protein JWM07_418 [Candidatus Saccharibacteria bacterium]|jgi:hypothetical protein|nr:hypothetical protein [Candidatus Saccharibacteria bacterium]
MLKGLKLSHHHHSGLLRPHEHTSYLPLGLILLGVGFILIAYSASAASPPPQGGSIGINGTMPGKPPTVAATIKTPVNGQRFSTTPVTVSGTCPPDTLVELFKNDIFAGSTPCAVGGTYTLDIDLLIGQNILVARVYDALNQAGPDSNAVTVFYDALPPQAGALTPLDFGGDQLLLNTDAVFRGVFPDKEMQMPLDILGGTPPYAINVQWGDSTNKVIPRNDNLTFNAMHIYKKPGTYQVSIQATDAAGRVAFLTVASIVNGQPAIVNSTTGSTNATNTLLVLWPLYVGAFAVVVSFWLGERREKQILMKRGMIIAS